MLKFFKDKLPFFNDGVTDVLNGLINRRNASNRNVFTDRRVTQDELRSIYKTGTANKIYRIKVGSALADAVEFDNKESEIIYKAKIENAVKKACMFQLGFGRGIAIIHEEGADLSQPLSKGKIEAGKTPFKIDVFSGDMVTVSNVERDLSSKRYYKPKFYTVRGEQVHWTRVADFTYIEPVEYELADYRYGGISEAELVYDELINDAIVQRSSSSIIEKNSNLFYKVKGLKDAMRAKQDEMIINYFSKVEDGRSIYGAGIIDADDDVMNITQALSNLKDVDESSLRRLAMVTGIPMSQLVGENVRGLNATGDNEETIFDDMIIQYRENYIKDPLTYLCEMVGLDAPSFKNKHDDSPTEEATYEKLVLENAVLMANLGQDYSTYLESKDVVPKEEFSFFKEG